MAPAVMLPLNAHAVSQALNFLNPPISRILPHFLQAFVSP
jgi:hypothetical protein